MHAIGEWFEDDFVVILAASWGVACFIVANSDSQRKDFISLSQISPRFTPSFLA